VGAAYGGGRLTARTVSILGNEVAEPGPDHLRLFVEHLGEVVEN
jgi:hypothetical protein